MTDGATTRRFTVEEYYRMGEAGILRDDERVELMEGEIVMLTPIGSEHAASLNRLNRLWASRLAHRAIMSIQNPVRLSPASQFQPDLALLRPRPDFYRKSHPEPADVLLLIEVADTTVEKDRRLKIPLYAKSGIQESWLLDLPADRIHVYRQSRTEGYQDVHSHSRGQLLTPEAFPDITLSVDDRLG
ncbi:MAG TPA: Uma2 family endonuclease [Candidatus Methylomirabilis sp.]|nr:Uma2 family endonuclease [Candidatus Methylomirabilis sp.]